MDIVYAKCDNHATMGETSAKKNQAATVAILQMPESYLSAVYGIKDLLDDAESRSEGSFVARVIGSEEFARARRRYDVVIVPPLRMPGESKSIGQAIDWRVVSALRRAAERGSLVCSVCAGAFYLCAAGIADGGRVTTHWRLAQALADSFPSVTVLREKILIDGVNYVTAGGITSYQDLCLHLIKRRAGTEVALATAGTFLINPEDRTQLQYVSLALSDGDGNGEVSKAMDFIKREFRTPIGLSEIAAHCGITVRTLLRRFRDSAAGSPGEILQSVRMAHAKKILQSGTVSAKAAATEAGYRDLAAFSRAFKKFAGVTPGEYGRRFRPR